MRRDEMRAASPQQWMARAMEARAIGYPANNLVVIRFDKAPVTTQAIIAIADMQGRSVINRTAGTNNGLIPIDISKLPSGVYVVSIVDMGYTIHSQKLVIQK